MAKNRPAGLQGRAGVLTAASDDHQAEAARERTPFRIGSDHSGRRTRR
jgi:hypothetical protein